MDSNRFQYKLAEVTDDDLRHEFLRLIAQEGRQHYMSQIAEMSRDSLAQSPLRVTPSNRR